MAQACLLVLVMAVSVAPSEATPVAEKHKRVLLLLSDESDDPAQIIVDQSLRSTLKSNSPAPVEVYSEYLDFMRTRVDDYEKELVGLLRRKYEGRKFDLIWCGSLITHLDEHKIRALLDFFSRHLATGGLLVFTAAGDRVAERMATRRFDYGIDKRKVPILPTVYQEFGYSYTDYPYLPDYGISLTAPEWIRSEVQKIGGLREVYFKPHGWDDHQDVYGFVKPN